MPAYQKIVVVHPGAIGDAVMGTPVSHALRAQFPDADIAYLTHPSLFPLLELAGTVNSFLVWEKGGSPFEMAKQLRARKSDLVIDLVGSLRTRLGCLLSGAFTLTLDKSAAMRKQHHVVDNYLATLAALGGKLPERRFPTLTPPGGLVQELVDAEDLSKSSPLVALVPGVGKHRPNRAWPPERFAELGNAVLDRFGGQIVLVGGEDDEATCETVEQLLSGRCNNLAGKLTLPETAALLSRCDLVVSADTGPAHIAVATGKPVVWLMGPTQFERTGPYGMLNNGVDVRDRCRCLNAKRCLVGESGGPGVCMKEISAETVMHKVEELLGRAAAGKDKR